MITGADSGIGKETAKILVQEGAKIVLSDLKEDQLEATAEEIRSFTHNKSDISTWVADLTQLKEVHKLAEHVKSRYGGADILAHCAGARGAAGDFLELSDEDWMETINIDLMGAVRVSRAFIPQMQQKGWGRLVLISSENAMQPYEEESPYNACKAAIVNLSKCLSRTYAKDGVLINCVSPAYIETPMTNAMMEELAKERGSSVDEAVDWFLKNKRPHIEVQRRGQADEVAAVIAFLCSELASFVNGSNYRVDGGSVETAFG
ncbi:SDR family NAD(P)-dependent oxidoreductase [Catalinimonas niigatensis]|uniref:SDR family NAD(P)-dependent oxidoreductase n=1 Tax=Catalinimonas niigatensis TaxID=1397264 RepID=UPI0026651390|nr:SDR family oxidoreductase [Catalinimonas niigatensis]WPP51179.1 SDR family oxidoreductase [Catalinimonas niigatensis]